VHIVQARAVEVWAEAEIPLRADNSVSQGRHFRFEVRPGALKVVRPHPGS
jgi:diacylglycerol kinase family enzyme